MKRGFKLLNFILFFAVGALFLLLQSYQGISTSLLSTLPDSKYKSVLENFEKSGSSKQLIVAVNGFDTDALKRIKDLEKSLLHLEKLEKIDFSINRDLQAHKEQYKLYTQELDREKLKTLDLKKEMKKLHQNLTSSFFPVNIERDDPLDLFKAQKNSNSITIKNSHLTLKEYGYVSYFHITSTNLEEHRELYNKIEQIVTNNQETIVFSPIFYYVENSQAIKSDINKILFIASITLLTLFAFILKDLHILLNTAVTLTTSIIISTIILTQLFSELSVFAVVFGVSISAIAVDYMFHHYLHGYYEGSKKGYNKEVLFGFITTASVFFIMSFTSFILIKQIAIFALFALFISYLHFAFLYPHIVFKKPAVDNKTLFGLKVADKRIVFIASIIMIGVSLFFLKLDLDLKKLDYKNTKLDTINSKVTSLTSSDRNIPISIEAQSIEELISMGKKIQKESKLSSMAIQDLVDIKSFSTRSKELEEIQHSIKKLKNIGRELGFRDGFFNNAYKTRGLPQYSKTTLKELGVEIFSYEGSYITFGSIDKESYEMLKKEMNIKKISLKDLFEDSMMAVKSELFALGLISILIIITLLYRFSKENLLQTLTFITFPLGSMLLFHTLFPLNLLQIFMIFIIIALSIDYGIYTSKNIHNKKIQLAIFYSLISTFAGFGVLVFSGIYSLQSIGITACIGIVSISFLLLFLKDPADETHTHLR